MKEKTKRRLTLMSCLSMILCVLGLVFSSITFAKYVVSKETLQTAHGLGGERQVSIFFNANVWTQGKDSSGNIVDANYYMYVWKTSSNPKKETILLPAAHVTPTISGVNMDLYVFEFDKNVYDSFLFLRWNPEEAPAVDKIVDYNHGKWNQTSDESYSSSYNYYCIDSWGTGTPSQATPTKNKIVKAANGSLSWAS